MSADRPVADTSHLERLYFDASHWNALCDHPQREEIIAAFDRSKRAVFPSVINAAELLNTRREGRRLDLCRLMATLQRADHAVIGHPETVLARAAEAFRRRDDSLTLGDGPAETVLRRWTADPTSATEEERELPRQWMEGIKKDNKDLRTQLRVIFAAKGFVGEAEPALLSTALAGLLFEKVPFITAAATSAEEVQQLVERVAVWRAFAASVLYEFHLQRRDLPAEERAKPPGGPDMMQLTYMGLVNRFILTDRGFLRAANWVARLLPAGMVVDVIESRDYFSEIGFPND